MKCTEVCQCFGSPAACESGWYGSRSMTDTAVPETPRGAEEGYAQTQRLTSSLPGQSLASKNQEVYSHIRSALDWSTLNTH